MPIYEYQCKHCNKEFEVLVCSSSAEVKCIHCDSKELQRKFSSFGMKSGEKFRSSSSSECGSCTSHSCGSCHCHG